MFRGSQSLGSISTLFQLLRKDELKVYPNLRRASKNISKSEETLDSLKRSFSDTEESLSEDSNSDTSEEKSSPAVVRKYTH